MSNMGPDQPFSIEDSDKRHDDHSKINNIMLEAVYST